MTPVALVVTALRALRANPMRSALTMLGIIIGVATVIVMIAVGSGAARQVSARIETLGANLLYVSAGAQATGGVRKAAGTAHTLTEGDSIAIAHEVRQSVVSVPMVSGRAQVVSGGRNWSTTVVGTWPAVVAAREWSLAEGRFFTSGEAATAAKVAVLGNAVARNVFGSIDPLGRIVRIAGVPFRVVGILRAKGRSSVGWDQDDVVYLPLAAAKMRLFGRGNLVDNRSVPLIVVKVASDETIPAAAEQIRKLLRQRHRLRPAAADDFEISNMESVIQAQEAASRTLTFQLAALASISLIVGGISIMNIMMASVTERTREIGLRLAVGARRRDIRRQFLAESITLCGLGGAVGIVVGVGTAMLLAHLGAWPMVIDPIGIAVAVAFAALVGIFFGLYPAHRASRLDPIDALRIE